MYKILILASSQVASEPFYKFYTNPDGTIFETDDLTMLSTRSRELLNQNPVPMIMPINILDMAVTVEITDGNTEVLPPEEPTPETGGN